MPLRSLAIARRQSSSDLLLFECAPIDLRMGDSTMVPSLPLSRRNSLIVINWCDSR